MREYVIRLIRGDAPQSSAGRVLIAYSGGMDSTVLLHVAAQCLVEGDDRLVAVHVNHGLNADADEWERFCRREATRLGVGFRCLRVNAAVRTTGVARGRSPEEAARAARYAALKALMQKGDVLMTAHHQSDQAETVLLQLLRGAGPDGLAGMPVCVGFGNGRLARPLLGTPYGEIKRYAHDNGLGWLDDPMNDDLRYSRNYLRRRLAPLLEEHWPAWQDTLSRVARHQAEARELIGQVARQRYLQCRAAGDTLSAARCRGLSGPEQKAVLRYWIGQWGLPTPSERQLLHLMGTLLRTDVRSGAMMSWPGAEIHHYRGCLYAMEPRTPLVGLFSWEWPCGTDLEMSEIGTKLTWLRLVERAPDLRDAPLLTVRLRRGSERCAYAGGRFHKRLKKVFQESGVPPWQRDRVPLIYLGDELRLVW